MICVVKFVSPKMKKIQIKSVFQKHVTLNFYRNWIHIPGKHFYTRCIYAFMKGRKEKKNILTEPLQNTNLQNTCQATVTKVSWNSCWREQITLSLSPSYLRPCLSLSASANLNFLAALSLISVETFLVPSASHLLNIEKESRKEYYIQINFYFICRFGFKNVQSTTIYYFLTSIFVRCFLYCPEDTKSLIGQTSQFCSSSKWFQNQVISNTHLISCKCGSCFLMPAEKNGIFCVNVCK